MRHADATGWRSPAVIACLIVLWLGATAWMRPLTVPDEGRYVGVAWEMMRSGDWLTPTLNGLPFFHKPPLFYWITAGAMSVFGLHEWPARLAPVLGASLGAFSLYLFVRRWSGERAALLTLVPLGVQPLFYVGGQFANLDMLVAGCISATIVLAAHAALCAHRALPYRRTLALAYAMAAVGVLAKGLIGIVLPALVVGAWLVLLRRWRVLWALVWWPGLLLFVLIAAPWFVAMQLRFPDFLDYFFVVQHFKRFSAGGFNNVQPFWFYPAVLLLFSLPWLPWLIKSLRRVQDGDDEQRAVRLLMLSWAGLVVAFFSLPQSKLVGYVLPAVPPLAALMAAGYAAGSPSARARRGWTVSAAVAGTLSLAAVIGLSVWPPHSLRDMARTLAEQRQSAEPVVMVGDYYYDITFYARLSAPPLVVEDWSPAKVQERDNWRKELADASRFAEAEAAAVLLQPAALPAALCAARVGWVIGSKSTAEKYPFLQASELVSSVRDTRLWKVAATTPAVLSALGCEGTPNAGSADR